MRKVSDVLVNVVAKSYLCPRQVRHTIYRLVGMKIGQAEVRPGVGFSGNLCSIGDWSWINHGTYFDCSAAAIEIGQNVGVGMGVMFVTTTHQVGKPERRGGPMEFKSVKVENGVWIGARAVILPGCTIGRGCIIAAGAVVTESCTPDGLYAGVPAKRLKDL